VLPVLLADNRFELRTHAYVKELVYDKQAKKVKAVRYVDTRSGEEFEQPAGIVILGAYVFNNVLLMRVSGIGEPYDPKTGQGVVGRNYCYQVSGNAVTVFFEDKEINPFMATGAHGIYLDDFNGDNFDHGGLGFFGGAWIQGGTGPRLEEGDRQVVRPRLQRRRVGLQLCAPRELSRSRPDLHRCARPSADPHDL
jgi:gluconate 2-dehydrogenase alpha chain